MLHDRHTLSCDSVAAADFVIHHTPHTPYTSHTHTLLLLHYTPLLCPPLICFDYLSIWHCAQWTFSQGRRPVTQLVVCRVSLSLSLCPVTVLAPPPLPYRRWVKTGVSYKWNCQLISLANLLNVSKKELALMGSFVCQLCRRRVGKACLSLSRSLSPSLSLYWFSFKTAQCIYP